MTFLNPVVLFGLAAAAIPVILHLLNLRKLRTIDFSTLTFLKELQQSKIRRLKLRQLLLLIVRTLMVVFIVLAFARPALRGSLPLALGGRAVSTVAIVFDDSFSMQLADENGERFRQAQAAARNIISLLKPGDAAYLVRLSDLPRVTVEPATHDFGALTSLIDRAEPSAIRRTLHEGIVAATRLLGESRDVNREMYVISDFQKSALGSSGTPGDTIAGDPEQIPAAPGVNVFLVPVGSTATDNASVDSVGILSGIFEKNRPVEIAATIRNHGGAPLRDAVVSVFTGETRVAQTNVTVPPASSRTVDLTFVPRGTGYVGGRVEIEPDELDPDNRRWFSFYIPDRVRVLVAGGSPADAKFVLTALRAGSGGGEESILDITPITAREFPRTGIRDYDVLLLCGFTAFSGTDADRIGDFVRDGGGLILFPGDSSDTENYNSALLRPLSLPTIRSVAETGGERAGLYFREIDFDHPVFAAVFDEGVRERDARQLSPGISKTVAFRPTPGSRPVVTLSDGGGFLVEQPLGRGRVLLFSIAPDLAWSDFPMKGIFAPLMHRSVVYLATDLDRQKQFTVGGEVSVTVRGTAPREPESQFGLRFPDGIEEFIMPAASPAGLLFRYPSVPRPGVCDLHAGGSVLAMFPVNTDPLEADIAASSDADVDAMLAGAGFAPGRVSRLDAGDTLPERITEARFGVELWKYCVGLVLLLALVEMIVNRRARGEHAAEA